MAGSIREPDTSQRPAPYRRRRRKVRRRKTVNEGAMIRIVSPVIGGHHGFPYFSYEIIGTAAVRLRRNAMPV